MKKDKFHGYPFGEDRPHDKDDGLLEYPYRDDLFFPYYTENLRFDPNGDYTGSPEEDGYPIQDAEDL